MVIWSMDNEQPRFYDCQGNHGRRVIYFCWRLMKSSSGITALEGLWRQSLGGHTAPRIRSRSIRCMAVRRMRFQNNLIHRYVLKLRVVIFCSTSPLRIFYLHPVGGVVAVAPDIKHTVLATHASLPVPPPHGAIATFEFQSCCTKTCFSECTPMWLLVLPGE